MKAMSVADFTGDPGIQKLQDELLESCAGKQFSDLVDDYGQQYIDLVMEGGGVLGIGAVRVSDKEQAALDELAETLGVSVT